ncbi:Ribonuclease E [Rhodobacteraceae bacterium THAF1]|uniref:Rne/Rng family ribonuclease n=1 Tax=Palleronia sp. THAF1 TaxID=2587842 RepID=UPI000F3B232B|nr:Rne/Rng family ribonuclease [Palleronia sp. THAF1]QFU08913.1 Ribonuclease E [Palleronia sp. THAF1]VDC24375.1 Ribonuclease E [Rhodobacteraceae bacterium THAF1]
MPKKMLIDATHAEETRVVVVDGNKVEEFDFESENKRQLAGNIYLAKVTRVEPSLQAAFIDYGGNRHGFLAFSEIHPDYYQIPIADRQALLEEEQADAEEERRQDEEAEKPRRRTRSRSRTKAADTQTDDAVQTAEVDGDDAADAQANQIANSVPGMDVVDLGDDEGATAPGDDHHQDDDDEPKPYVAADDASERDETIESVADDDTPEDVRPKRKPRAKKYKIQEVIKVRQILLVQVVKEERGNKGAALTTYLSLAGRYCVLMPNTARGGGISRKITNVADRKKLKEIAQSIEVPKGAGLIVRTAGAKRTKTEIKRDYEYLQRMWEQIRELTLKSVAPAAIYEEGNLIKRSIRDLYNREIDEVWVEGDNGYRTAKDFMKMIMPSHAKNVKHYVDPMPLYARHQVESYLGAMFNPDVRLPSGGYIVIGVTEALVAIDVNSGRSTKEGSIEDTAYRTNMEAAEEVARQLRLRDLAGLIVIDFIDMEDRKHNANVEKHFKEKLKTDRARIQVGRISGFGLLEMSRQRLRPGMIEATTQPCAHCHGTGLLRSDDNVALAILRHLEEEGTRKKSREVCVTAPVAICNYLMNQKREHIALIEARYGMAVRLEADPSLISPDFKIEKLKHQTIRVVEQTEVITSSKIMEDEPDDDIPDEVIEDEAPEAPDAVAEPVAKAPEADSDSDSEDRPKKKRRRRRRGGRRKTGENGENGNDGSNGEGSDANDSASDDDDDTSADQSTPDAPAADDAPQQDKPKRRRSRSRSRRKSDDQPTDVDAPVAAAVSEQVTEDAAIAPPVPEENAPQEAVAESQAEAPAPQPEPAVEEPVAEKPASKEPEVVDQPVPESVGAQITEDAPVAPPAPQEDAAETANDDDKPKRRGWWSLRR